MNQDRKFKYYINEVLSKLPFRLLLTIRNKKIILPLYHMVSDVRVAHFIHLAAYASVKQFEKDLDFFQKYYNPISLDELLQNLDNNRSIRKRSFLLSFDDGYSEMYDIVAPILKRRSLPAVFFINTNFIDNRDMSFRNKTSIILERLKDNSHHPDVSSLKNMLGVNGETGDFRSMLLNLNYGKKHVIDEIARSMDIDFKEYLWQRRPFMSTEQIKSLIDQGFNIGAHSLDHPLYSELSLEEQKMQTVKSIQFLKESFNIDCSAFAFPFTDKGVHQDFFQVTDEYLKVSFGTQNFSEGRNYKNLQRQPMERGVSAERTYRRLLSDLIYPQ